MANTDRQTEQESWLLGVRIQAGDRLEDVRTRLLADLREAVASHALPPARHWVAQRLLAEADGTAMAPTGYTTHPGPSFGAATMPEPEPTSQTDTAAADHPLFQGYSVVVTTHRAPGVPSCDLCGSPIAPRTSYRKVRVGCQRYRVHWNCLSRAQEQIAAALESSGPAIEDEPEENSNGNR